MMRLEIPGVYEQFKLSKTWKRFLFPRPTNDTFTINYLNDKGPGYDVNLRDASDFDISCYSFKNWNCGNKEENERCQWVRNGWFLWTTQYTLRVK